MLVGGVAVTLWVRGRFIVKRITATCCVAVVVAASVRVVAPAARKATDSAKKDKSTASAIECGYSIVLDRSTLLPLTRP
jgi:hypothetical protein